MGPISALDGAQREQQHAECISVLRGEVMVAAAKKPTRMVAEAAKENDQQPLLLISPTLYYCQKHVLLSQGSCPAVLRIMSCNPRDHVLLSQGPCPAVPGIMVQWVRAVTCSSADNEPIDQGSSLH